MVERNDPMNNKDSMIKIYSCSREDNANQTVSLIYDIGVIKAGKEIKRDALTYTINKEYEPYLCYEVADSVIVTLLPYAIRGGFHIVSNVPMTERLKYTLTEQLIPQLAVCNDILQSEIIADTRCFNWAPTAVATAMSCGVDSFATLYENFQSDVPQSYKITHLTFFENGAHHLGTLGHSVHEPEVYKQQLDAVKGFCAKNGYRLIDISSNVDEFLSEMFWRDSFDRTHTYRNAGFVLLLQKLIKIYYYSPAYNVDEFNCSVNADSAHYEKLLLPNVSTEYTTLYNSSGSKSRLDKIRFISQFPETYDSLLVCYAGGENCGKCLKCKRTLVELDILGVLKLYTKCFNLDEYQRNRTKFFVWCLSKRKSDKLMKEIYDYIIMNKPSIPKGVFFFSELRRCGVIIAMSMFRLKRTLKSRNK